MYMDTLGVVILICGYAVNIGTGADPSRCIERTAGDPTVIKPQYCLVTKRDVRPSCPENELVVLSGLQMAIKSTKEVCTKRVLGSRSEFCCFAQPNDLLYSCDCLQQMWNKEDNIHYQKFISEILDKCRNTSQCVLKADMFTRLQREIPSKGTYSSYFHVLYKCIPAPIQSISLCSSKSQTGKDIHIYGNKITGVDTDKTCMCRVTSHHDVIMRAIDVRPRNYELIIRSNKMVKNISQGHLPLYGFKEILTAKNIILSLKMKSLQLEDNLWLHVAGSNGKSVKVKCGAEESIYREEKTSTIPESVLLVTQGNAIEDLTVYVGHWPLIYIAAGSLFTIVIVACILGSVLLCRHSKDKEKRHHHPPCGGHPPIPDHAHHPAYFHQHLYDSPYATVMDAPHRGDNSLSPQTLDRRRHVGAPPSMSTPEGGADVSQLEAFLNCKESSETGRHSGLIRIQ